MSCVDSCDVDSPVEKAIQSLLVGSCPLDGFSVVQDVSFNKILVVYYICPEGHTWTCRYNGPDDWTPDPNAVREKLEEQGLL